MLVQTSQAVQKKAKTAPKRKLRLVCLPKKAPKKKMMLVQTSQAKFAKRQQKRICRRVCEKSPKMKMMLVQTSQSPIYKIAPKRKCKAVCNYPMNPKRK